MTIVTGRGKYGDNTSTRRYDTSMRRHDGEIRTALIGYGAAGAFFHAPLIAATRGMRLAAIVTADPERSRGAALAYPGARIVPDGDAIWKRADDFDLVVIATPNRTHVPLAERALNAGLATVVDKPLARTAAEGRRLIQLAQRTDALLTVFQNRRWDGDLLTAQRLLSDGALGTVSRFESRFERWRPIAKPGWRQDADPDAAGGVLFDLGSHLIDQALLLFGAVSHVYAELDRRTVGSDVDDDTFVALSHESGVRSHLWMSTAAAQHGPRLRVLGCDGAYTKYGLDVQEAALRSGARPDQPDWGTEDRGSWGLLGAGDAIRAIPTVPGAYPEFYRGVIRAMREGGAPPVDPADAVATARIIEAARQSATNARVVSLSAEPAP